MSDSWLLSRPSTLVPNTVILDKSLSVHARLLYAYILGRAGKRGWFFPDGGVQEMADDLGMGERTVRRSIDALVVAGLITTARTNHYGAMEYRVGGESPATVAETPAEETATAATQASVIRNSGQRDQPNTGSEHTPDKNTREEQPDKNSRIGSEKFISEIINGCVVFSSGGKRIIPALTDSDLREKQAALAARLT